MILKQDYNEINNEPKNLLRTDGNEYNCSLSDDEGDGI